MVSLESEISGCILSQTKWSALDDRLKDLIGSSQEYDKRILKYSIENQLRYRGNLVRHVVNNEFSYYKQLLDYSREHLMLFPYHLSDFIIAAMRITPFQYYLSTMSYIIEQEKSYDTLPNFTAADCLRLLSIGRNQYIEIMNQARSYRKFLGFGLRKAKHFLPQKPNENVNIEPWWFINAGYITEEDVRTMVSIEEKSIIDRLITAEGISNQIPAMDVDARFVRSLYLKGLIYLDVPIYDDDLIIVPPLEGFVMNRITGDYFETLLYKIFVSIDQNTPVIELAGILDIDIRLVKNAVSMYCRLGFAHKRNLYIHPDKYHSSWKLKLDEYQRLGINIIHEASKNHSNSNKEISDFMFQLASIENSTDVGTIVDECPLSPTELCVNLERRMSQSSSTFLTYSSGVSASNTFTSLAPNLSATQKKVVLLFDSNLTAFLMMGNMSSQLKNHAVTMFEVGKFPDESIDSLLYELAKIKNRSLDDDGYEATRYYTHAIMLHRTIEFLRTDPKLASDLELGPSSDNSSNKCETETVKIGLDLIRVESLAALDAKSCQRLLQKNYKFVISCAPLSQEVKLEAVTGLPNLGPGSPLINSLWFRLYIYHMTGYGPTSLLLVRGSRLNYLPSVFQKSSYLLLTAWSRDPVCVPTVSALLTINDIVTHFPVLIQAYPVDFDDPLSVNREKVFIPLPLCHIDTDQDSSNSNLQNIPSIRKLSQVIDLQHLPGYITLLKNQSLIENESEDDYKIRKYEKKTDQPETVHDAPIISDVSNGHDKSIDEHTKSIYNEDDYQLFNCTFGVPLFDELLNGSIIKRISENGLCTNQSLMQLTKFAIDLDSSLAKFIDEFSMSIDRKELFKRDADDQRHFFTFPDTEQFSSMIPRPAECLLFHNGKLGSYKPIL